MQAGLYLALTTLLVTGCDVKIGDKVNKLDHTKAEKLLTDHFAKQEAVVKKATCPKDVPIKKDATFLCNVTAENGDILEVEFTQTDGKGNVKVTKSDTILVTRRLHKAFRDFAAEHEVAKDLKLGDIRCPPDHKPKKGESFDCEIDVKGKSPLVLRVEELDDQGQVNFNFVGIINSAEEMASKLQKELKAKKIMAKVDCGKKPLKLVVKAALECSAEDDKGKKAQIRIVPTNAFGAFDWNVL